MARIGDRDRKKRHTRKAPVLMVALVSGIDAGAVVGGVSFGFRLDSDREGVGGRPRIFQEIWVTDFACVLRRKKGAPGAPFVFMLTWWLGRSGRDRQFVPRGLRRRQRGSGSKQRMPASLG